MRLFGHGGSTAHLRFRLIKNVFLGDMVSDEAFSSLFVHLHGGFLLRLGFLLELLDLFKICFDTVDFRLEFFVVGLIRR